MGYSKTILLSEEEFSKIEVHTHTSCYRALRAQATVMVMKGAEYKDIQFILRQLRFDAEYSLRYDWTVEWNSAEYTPQGTLSVCGWEYSHDGDSDINEVIDSVCEDLYIISHTVAVPDYFDDGERWSQYMEEVQCKIDYVCDSARECLTHQLFDSHTDYYEDLEKSEHTESPEDGCTDED